MYVVSYVYLVSSMPTCTFLYLHSLPAWPTFPKPTYVVPNVVDRGWNLAIATCNFSYPKFCYGISIKQIQ